MAGKFISFEGGEGSGKSTQVKLLAESLRKTGLNVILTREPGGSPASEEIRDLLVSGAVDRWSPMAEVLLNYAAREMHVKKTIQPALERGDWVITDRFFDSTLAYQGYGGGVDPLRIDAIRKIVLDQFAPDLTLILDLPGEEGLNRAGKRMLENKSGEDRFERMERDFHHRLRDGFLTIAAAEPTRCRVIEASGDETQVASRVMTAVSVVWGAEVA
jgi:dTMP kinase